MKNKFLLFFVSLLIAACAAMNPFAAKNDRNINRIPFDLIDNRIFVQVMINGQGPFKFVFDTGGRNCMTPELAKILNLPLKAIENANGAGEKSVNAWTVQTKTFQVGGLSFSSQDFMVIDFSSIKNAFKFSAFDGLFGFEFLQKYSAKVDFVGQRISFLPIGSEKANELTSIPFTLVADKPVISARINNLKANILIDTGDRSALTVFSNFRKEGAIKNAFDGKKSQITGYGIGGPIPAILSEVDSVEIGSQIKIENVIARAPVIKGGFNAIDDVNASIGNEILKQFEVTFDYQNKLIAFRPNKFYGQRTRFVPIPNL